MPPSPRRRPRGPAPLLGACLGLALGLAALGCSRAPGWRPLDPTALDADQQARLERARRASQALGGALKERLTAAMADGGPVAAIDVCRSAAAEITGQVAADQKVRIGRTSHRLRNPANAPPAWAAAHVAEAEAKLGLWSGPDAALGVLLPIPTAGVCVNCHGPREAIIAPVREALAKHYPEDRAVGFSPEQLRGWFWVEVR